MVAGLPVAVHDDVAEARAAQAEMARAYADQLNFRRVIALVGAASAADTAIVGDERSVAAQLQALLDAGATEIHAAIVPVGDDARASVRRTCDLLASLVG